MGTDLASWMVQEYRFTLGSQHPRHLSGRRSLQLRKNQYAHHVSDVMPGSMVTSRIELVIRWLGMVKTLYSLSSLPSAA